MTTKQKTIELSQELITDNVIVDTETGCWNWKNSVTRDGYGQEGRGCVIRATGQKLAHRISFTLFKGKIPEGRQHHIMHSCDNRQCCNPDHLSIGDAKQNADHMKLTGRDKFRQGENNSHAAY